MTLPSHPDRPDATAWPPVSREDLTAQAVFEAHGDYMWASLQRLGVRPHDLEDMLQEALIVVHRRAFSFEGRSAFRTWLFGVCLQLARNYRKKAFRRREDQREGRPEPAPHHADPGARLEAERLLARLDPEKRAVFVMFEGEQLRCAEIAELIGVPVGTVYSRLHSARRELAELLRAERELSGEACVRPSVPREEVAS